MLNFLTLIHRFIDNIFYYLSMWHSNGKQRSSHNVLGDSEILQPSQLVEIDLAWTHRGSQTYHSQKSYIFSSPVLFTWLHGILERSTKKSLAGVMLTNSEFDFLRVLMLSEYCKFLLLFLVIYSSDYQRIHWLTESLAGLYFLVREFFSSFKNMTHTIQPMQKSKCEEFLDYMNLWVYDCFRVWASVSSISLYKQF